MTRCDGARARAQVFATPAVPMTPNPVAGVANFFKMGASIFASKVCVCVCGCVGACACIFGCVCLYIWVRVLVFAAGAGVEPAMIRRRGQSRSGLHGRMGSRFCALARSRAGWHS